MKAFDIKYHSTRLGIPDIKFHRFVAEDKPAVIKALEFWKGAKESDIISCEEVGEFNPSERFTISV